MNSINIPHIEAKIMMTRNHTIDGKIFLIVKWILTYNNRIYISDIFNRNKLITENMIINDIKIGAANIYFSNVFHRFISDTEFFYYGTTYYLLEEMIIKVNKERLDDAILSLTRLKDRSRLVDNRIWRK